MEDNFEHKRIILKEGVLKLEVNPNIKPKIRRYINWTDVFKHEMIGWNIATKYFNFASEEESIIRKMFLDSSLISGINVDFKHIEIKDELAYYIGDEYASENEDDKIYTKEQMIMAAKYGHNYRDKTSFPKHTFEQECRQNFLQYLESII